MNKIKNLLFDLGGVIITLDQPQAVRRFKEIGLVDAEERLDPYTQSGLFGALEKGEIDAEQFRAGLSDIIGHEVTMEQCLYGWKGYVADLPARNLVTLRGLRDEGYRIVLVSNTNPFLMSWALSDEFDGNGHSLADYMDAMYMSYKCGVMKPEESFFRHVLEKENLRPEETLLIDDGPRNIESAARLGLNTFCPENGADWTSEIYKYLNK